MTTPSPAPTSKPSEKPPAQPPAPPPDKPKPQAAAASGDAEAQLKALRNIIFEHAKEPGRMAILLALHLEGGTVSTDTLKGRYGFSMYSLDMVCRQLKYGGYIHWDGNTVTLVAKA